MKNLYLIFFICFFACFDFSEGTGLEDNTNVPEFPVYSATVYVGKQYNEERNGTYERPYESINRALDHFRHSTYFNSNPDIVKNIILLSDLNITINLNENIVIDRFSNLTISSEGQFKTILISNNTDNHFFTITNSNNITISNIKFILNVNEEDVSLFNINNNNNIKFEDNIIIPNIDNAVFCISNFSSNNNLKFNNNTINNCSLEISYSNNNIIKFNNNIFNLVDVDTTKLIKINKQETSSTVDNLNLEIISNEIRNQSLVLDLYLNNPDSSSTILIDSNKIYDTTQNTTPVLEYALKIIGNIILSAGSTAQDLIKINKNYLYSKQNENSNFGFSFYYQLFEGAGNTKLFTPSCSSMNAENANKFCHYQITVGGNIIKSFDDCKDTTFHSYINFTTGKQPNYFPCSNYCFIYYSSYSCNQVQ